MASEKKMNIYQKIFEIQKLNLHIGKNAEAGVWSKWWYKYATLDKIWDEINEKMAELWLLETSHLKVIDGESYVESEIIDVDGSDTISSVFPIDKTLSPQDIWKAITYGRRYNLVALLNLKVVGDDDDAQGVRGKKKEKEEVFEADWWVDTIVSTNNREKWLALRNKITIGEYKISEKWLTKLDKFLEKWVWNDGPFSS